MDTLFAEGKITRNLFATSFEPVNPEQVVNGELTLGGIDPRKFVGEIDYFAITNNTVGRHFWAIDMSLRYGGGNGGASVNLTNATVGFLDTGSTLSFFSSALFKRYANVTGAALDNNNGHLKITREQYANLQSLHFDIGGKTFELTANAQIFPRSLNGLIDGEADDIYLAVGDGEQIYPGVDVVCAMPFLERFYAVFDSDKKSVGLARTPFTNANTN